MSGGVASVSAIGFHFDQPEDQALAARRASHETAADQRLRHDSRVSCIEGLTQWRTERHGSSIRELVELAPRFSPMSGRNS
jgi:hypothetical protein